MAKLDLASSEWCQLIFEGKNQAYGAYRMRANSTKRHNVAMLIVVIIAAIFFLQRRHTVSRKRRFQEQPGWNVMKC